MIVTDLHTLVTDLHSIVTGLYAIVTDLHSIVTGLYAIVTYLHSIVTGLYAIITDLHTLVIGLYIIAMTFIHTIIHASYTQSFMLVVILTTHIALTFIHTIIHACGDTYNSYCLQTGNALAFFLYNLASNPSKQQVLVDEINTVLGEGHQITPQLLQKMSYLKAALRESFRFVAYLAAVINRGREGGGEMGIYV